MKKFTVTEEDIEKADTHDILSYSAFRCCPVAQCLMRETGEEHCGASPEELMIGDKWFEAPEEVFRFIDDFDNGRDVSPITFELPY